MSNIDYKAKYLKYKTKYLNLKLNSKQNGGGELFRIHVSQPWFELIKDGKKTVEGRLNKNDFAKMTTGDIIEFYNRDMDDRFRAQIIKVNKYNSFEEMITANGLENVLPGIKTLDEGIGVYRKYYSEHDEQKFGVIGVVVSLSI